MAQPIYQEQETVRRLIRTVQEEEKRKLKPLLNCFTSEV
jgi:hypothetical protein